MPLVEADGKSRFTPFRALFYAALGLGIGTGLTTAQASPPGCLRNVADSMLHAPPRQQALAEAHLPASGARITADGNPTAFIKYRDQGYPNDFHGRVTRLWSEAGALHIEVEQYNPFAPDKPYRHVLTPGEVANARPSVTAHKLLGSLKAAPAGADKPSPGQTIAALRADTIQRLFPPDWPTRVETEFGLGPRRHPRDTMRSGNFLQTLKDREGLIFENTSVAALPRGERYTYVITADGKLTFGRVTNSLEYGVKHIHLANGKPVLVAGELTVRPDGTIAFNLESGSFTRQLIKRDQVSEEKLERRVKLILEQEPGAGRVERVPNDAILKPVSKQPPTVEELARICGDAGFHYVNRWICR